MSTEQKTYEDLEAFEKRLTEVISCLRPRTITWRILLILATLCTAIGAWQWLNDPLTKQIAIAASLFSHLFFTLSSLVLAFLLITGIHNRVVAPSIVTKRVREVLEDFSMSCDDKGKLILKPYRNINKCA